MNEAHPSQGKKRWLLPGVVVGVAALALAYIFKPSPPLSPTYDRSRLVEILELKWSTVAPEISAYGRVEPKNVWQAVAELGGKLIYRNPELETGKFLPKGTVLLTIDPLEYQLKLDQARESVNATRAKLMRIDQQEKNLNSSLKIEKQKYQLAQQDYQRKRSLNKKQLLSDSALEQEKQSLLAQQKIVQDLESQLKLLPDDRKVNSAQLSVDEAALKDAERKLEQTEVVLPFNGRVGEVNVVPDQVVNQGSVMVVAQQLGQVEIKAEVSFRDMRTLIRSLGNFSMNGELPAFEKLGFSGRVELRLGDTVRRLPARVTRVAETVNTDQATVGVFLEVDDDPLKFNPIVRPPLTKGMLVTTYITGIASPQFVIPERALHGKLIYLMDADDKLQIIPAEVVFRTKKGVAIRAEIAEGDRLVLTDLIPAVPGMALRLTDNLPESLVGSDQIQEAQQ